VWGSALRSYIRIYGPPVAEAIKALEKIAVDMPTVCIMDSFIEKSHPVYGDHEGLHVSDEHAVVGITDYAEGVSLSDWTSRYFTPMSISKERCDKIISRYGEMLGDFDFFFEWFTKPTMNQIEELIDKIDGAFSKLGCFYTIVTK